jgi:hypothetical protein
MSRFEDGKKIRPLLQLSDEAKAGEDQVILSIVSKETKSGVGKIEVGSATLGKPVAP